MPGRTTAAGLGYAHQRQRRIKLAALIPGEPCPRCGFGMWPTAAAARRAGMPEWCGRLDLDDWPGRIYGGPQVKRLAHAYCNRRAGAAVTNRIRRVRRVVAKTGRW